MRDILQFQFQFQFPHSHSLNSSLSLSCVSLVFIPFNFIFPILSFRFGFSPTSSIASILCQHIPLPRLETPEAFCPRALLCDNLIPSTLMEITSQFRSFT
jgi:hypothetical protein